MKTIVAVTSQNKKTVTKHAGECRNYFIYAIENNKIASRQVWELHDNEILKYTFHEDKSANPKNVLYDVDILLTGSIGRGGVNRLANQNVTAYVIKEKDPDTAVEKLIKGTLEAFAPVSHHKDYSNKDKHNVHCKNCNGHQHTNQDH